MSREQRPLRPIRVDYKCDKCDAGYMRSTGMMLMGNPPQFPHRCNACDQPQTFTEKYPTIKYAEEGELLNLNNYRQNTL